MKRLRIALTIPLALLAFATVAWSASGSLEGRWLLVEQTYGKGESNLASPDEPVILELFPGAGGLDGRWLAPGGDPAKSSSWPVWRAEGRPLPIQILKREIVPGGGILHASYVVAPSEGDGLLLEVDEAYALEPGGEALSGIVKVVFRAGEETRGSYTLHRRFERLH